MRVFQEFISSNTYKVCTNTQIYNLISGVTVKMHSPKIALHSNYLPGNKNSPVFFSQEIITPRSIYLLVKYHSLQEIWTPL